MRFQNECDKVAMINQDEITHRIKKLTYHFSVNCHVSPLHVPVSLRQE